MNQHPSKQKLRPPSKEFVDGFKLDSIYEFQTQLLLVLFFVCAFSIVHFLQFTLISILKSSQLLALFAASGFVLFYLFRDRFRMGLLDGLYYSIFGVAPLVFAMFLLVNSFGTDSYTETYRIIHFGRGGNGFVYELEGDAYDGFWRIRNFDPETVHVRNQHITYTFCNGVFGYKVMKDARFD